MANDLDIFVPKHDFLICVDSDGCAMDTMDVKHYRCFGPCMVDEWGLEEWREPILRRGPLEKSGVTRHHSQQEK